MKIGFDDLRAFVTVAELSGFKLAAARLNVTQSALTQRVGKLEDYLGTRLFNRTTRQVELTEIGRTFLPSALRVLHEFTGSLSDIADVIAKRRGVVCFACLLTVAYGFVPRILETFRKAHPNVKVRLLDETGLRVADRVRAGEAEFGIDMRLQDGPEFDFEPVAEEPYVMACSKDHPLAGRGPLRWAALNQGSYVAFGLESGIGRQLATPQAALTWDYEVQHLGTMIGLLQTGFGVGVVPYSVMHNRKDAGLVSRPLIEPPVTRTIGIIKRKGAALSPAAESLREIAVREIRTAYGGLSKRRAG